MKKAINLGCGKLPMEGYKNIDVSPAAKADETYDCVEEIREKDNSIDEVYSGCMMEQITSNDDFKHFLNEVHRVLKPGCSFKGYVPSNDPGVMFLDPMDRRFFQEKSFDYFVMDKHHWQEFGSVYGFMGWTEAKTSLNNNGIIHFELKK